jgi:dephospho-CoA kinase
MAERIIGLAGEIASGKTTAAKYLAGKHNAQSYRFSTPLREILERIYIPTSRENLTALSIALRQTFGEDVFSTVTRQDVERSPSPLIVIDGIRRLQDISALRDLPGFTLIYLEAPLETRFERITKRGENEDDLGKTWEQFKKDHELETERQIQALKPLAAEVISNAGSMVEFQTALDGLIA